MIEKDLVEKGTGKKRGKARANNMVYSSMTASGIIPTTAKVLYHIIARPLNRHIAAT